MSQIKWSAATRKKLHGYRARTKLDPVDAAPSADESWAQLRALHAAPGQVTSGPEQRGALARVLPQFDLGELPAFEADVELHRAACVLDRSVNSRNWEVWADWAPERALIGFWLGGAGVGAVIDQLLRPGTFWCQGSTSQSGDGPPIAGLKLLDASPSAFAEPQPPWDFRHALLVQQLGAWSALRCQMAALSDGAFEQATAVAHAARQALPKEDGQARSAIAFAFSRDATHAQEELGNFQLWPERQWATWAWPMLLVSAPNLEAASALQDLILEDRPSGISDFAFDLLESFGDRTRPLFERAVAVQTVRPQASWLRAAMLKPLTAALKLMG